MLPENQTLHQDTHLVRDRIHTFSFYKLSEIIIHTRREPIVVVQEFTFNLLCIDQEIPMSALQAPRKKKSITFTVITRTPSCHQDTLQLRA